MPGELLGQGGFADVHAAELADPLLPSFSESVAVKRLRPDVLKSPDDLREFLTEANLLRKLQHRWGAQGRGGGQTWSRCCGQSRRVDVACGAGGGLGPPKARCAPCRTLVAVVGASAGLSMLWR